MLDFGLLPPEVNSGRMYLGPGPGPMLAAAEAWDALAFELGFASAGYGSTLTELTDGPWIGPTSLAMTTAVTPYVNWLRTTAAEAEQTANQARAAAAAYEAAFAMTVPPPVVAANRALSMALIATNFFGQNTGAIMATEALYAEMWAQDAVAMYGYAGASAAAIQVTPFSAPPQTANQDEASSQANAVAKAAAAPASQAATVVQNAVTAAPTTSAQTAATTTSATTATTTTSTAATTSTVGTTTATSSWLSWLPAPLGTGPALTTANYTTILKQTLQGYFGLGLGQFGASIQQQLTFGVGTTAGSGGAWYPTPQFAGLGHGGGAVSAGVGHAKAIGRLSVPPNWQAAAPVADDDLVNLEDLHLEELEEEELIRLELEHPQLAGAIHAYHAASRAMHAAAAGGPASNGLLGGVPMGASSGGRGSGFVVRYGFRHAVMARPPSAG